MRKARRIAGGLQAGAQQQGRTARTGPYWRARVKRGHQTVIHVTADGKQEPVEVTDSMGESVEISAQIADSEGTRMEMATARASLRRSSTARARDC